MIALALLAVAVAAQDQPQKKRPGLEAQLISPGVTQERMPYLTASVKLTNNSPLYVFVLPFGTPHAVDDAGGDLPMGAIPLAALRFVSAGKDPINLCGAVV